MHGTNNADVVDAFSHLRKYFAHFDSALAVLFETERRAQQISGLALGFQVGRRHRLAVVLGKQRLRIEGINLRRPAVEEEKDDMLGFGREVGRFGCQRTSGLRTLHKG
jgi:hypothetical protein